MRKNSILLVVLCLLLTGCSWFTSITEEFPLDKIVEEGVDEIAEEIAEEIVTEEEDVVPEANEMTKEEALKDELDAMGPGPFDYNATLEDVSGGNATGEVGASFHSEGYNVYAQFKDLPDPADGYFYEGWVVRKLPLSVISTGKANKSVGTYTNGFSSDDDLTNHPFYVLTLEPDDGDPAPAEHILEGTMTK